MSVTLKIRNKDRLLRKLGELAPNAQKHLETANQISANDMATAAQRFAPVRTGALRDSIVVTPPGQPAPDYSQGGGVVVPPGAYAVTAGNSRVRYAHFAEYGTSAHDNAGIYVGTRNPGARRQPFFWPAYRLIRRRLKSRASAALRKSAKEVAARGGSK